MGELSVIFRELIRMLKDLPPGGFDKAYSRSLVSATVKPVSFMCDKQAFKEAVRLAEMGARLAEQAQEPRENLSDPLAATILAGFESLEAKVDQLALDTATLATKQASTQKSYSEAAAQPGPKPCPQPKQNIGLKRKNPPAASTPPKAPRLVLSQSSSVRDRFVELNTDASALASRANVALKEAFLNQSSRDGNPPPPFTIRAITRNNYTGDLQLHFDSQASLKAVLALRSDTWVSDINPLLTLKQKVYPIIIHGMPTSFNPHSRVQVHDFIKNNQGVLDTCTRIVWANKYSIESGKPYSSLIVHLTDPVAANTAIRNRICFRHLLKVTERSTKGVRQCYTCLDYGHHAKTCPESFRSYSHCAGAHTYKACSKRDKPLCCVNCTQKFLGVSFPGITTVTTSDLTPEQRASCIHSPFSNSCPLRRAQTAPMAHVSDLYEIESNE